MKILLTKNQINIIQGGLACAVDFENFSKSDDINQSIIRVAKSIEKQTGIKQKILN